MAARQLCIAWAPISLPGNARSLLFQPISGRAPPALALGRSVAARSRQASNSQASSWRRQLGRNMMEYETTAGLGLLSLLGHKGFDLLLQLIELALHFLEIIFGTLLGRLWRGFARRLIGGLF